jgi:NurA-like 5'-3' nuclease
VRKHREKTREMKKIFQSLKKVAKRRNSMIKINLGSDSETVIGVVAIRQSGSP